MATPIINAIRGSHIARRGSLHALVVTENNPTTVCWLMLWTSVNDVRYLSIPGFQPWELSPPALAFVGSNNLTICSGLNGGAGPMKVIEYEVGESELTQVGEPFVFGDTTNRAPDAIRLSNTGAMFVSHQQRFPNVAPEFNCDIVVRKPDVPNLVVAEPYIIQHFDWPSPASNQWPSSTRLVQGSNGLVSLFWTRDSMGSIGMARFNQNGQLVDVDGNFISGALGQDLAPSIEFPKVFTAVSGEQVLLSYQNLPHGEAPNCNVEGDPPVITSRTAITSISVDKQVSLVGIMEWPVWHKSDPWPCIWPRPDGIYFLNEFYDTNQCSTIWRNGVFVNGQFLYTEFGAGHVEAYSDDGWVVFSEPGRVNPTLVDLKFRSTLKIERWSCQAKQVTEFRITWDKPTAGQQLQQSADLLTWEDIEGATSSPVIVANAAPQMFFRLKER